MVRRKSATGIDSSLPIHLGDDEVIVAYLVHLYSSFHQALLTSLGMLTLTVEEANAFVARLEARGELVEHDLLRIVDDLISARDIDDSDILETQSGDLTKVTEVSDKRIEKTLACLDVPTMTDIHELGRKIKKLDERIAGLAEGIPSR